jgi:hypothetical protein
MNDVKATVGGAFEDEAPRQFIDAWHRAERGEIFCEHYRSFESEEARVRAGEPHADRKEKPDSSRQA